MSGAPTRGSFRATIELAGKTATGVEVPDECVTALGSSRRPAVHATIAGYTYRSSVASMRGRFMLPIGEAKTPETRARRIAKTVEKLREGRA
jgi:uncharacterized protein YdeI (YjbR/CyaY-like superfamily)